jgi:hypothetical protein
VLFSLIPLVVKADTYIVPIWASNLAASDGYWWAQAIVSNPGASPVTFEVSRSFPLQTVACEGCSGVGTIVTIAPSQAVVLTPPSGTQGQRLTAGAFEIHSSGPIKIDVVAFRPGASEIRQRLDEATCWLPAGLHVINGVQRGGSRWRMNVFVVNPGEDTLRVAAWVGNRAENEMLFEVPARTLRFVTLPPPKCGGVPCLYPDEFPPLPLRVAVEADGRFVAGVSSIDDDWAVFTLADESNICHGTSDSQ